MDEPLILLPGDPGFSEILGMALPPGWRGERDRLNGDYAFVADHQTGILRTCSFDGLDDYIEGGEYEERLGAIGDDDLLAEFHGEYA
jgi:hypothetical protein